MADKEVKSLNDLDVEKLLSPRDYQTFLKAKALFEKHSLILIIAVR